MALLYRIIIFFGLFFVKIIISTYKLLIIEINNSNSYLEKEEKPVIYLTLHQRFIPVLGLLILKTPIVVMISNSIDGEIISRIVRPFGVRVVRGSSSKNGSAALKQMIPFVMNRKCSIGFALDGPNGPIGIVKPGVIKMAQITRNNIVPVAVSCSNYWIYNSWDKFIIPKPFSKIRFFFSKKIKVNDKLSRREFESKRVAVEFEIQQIYKKIDNISWL